MSIKKPSKILAGALQRYENPKTTVLDFFGGLGVSFVMPGMTLFALLSVLACNETNMCKPTSLAELSWSFFKENTQTRAFVLPFVVYHGWLLWLVALYFILPADKVSGTTLRNGTKLLYPVNGNALVSYALLASMYGHYGRRPFIWIADNTLGLVVSSFLVATMQAILLYMLSFRAQVMLSVVGNSGNPIYDFFIGRELNPRIFGLDLKYFCELRPGIIGWTVLNICFAVKQYHSFGYITNSMWIVIISQILYALDSLWFESAVLTTMDITTEGFGWMLSMGDLCWLPAVYTIQARYLSFTPIVLSDVYCFFIAAMSVCSYLVFRLSNSQKNNFRSNPNSKISRNNKYLETKAGSKLLISGWWGLARHINYTGDWFLGLSQCLATGFGTPYTYFFSAYFLALLLHRNARDEHKCMQKYGNDWDKYCSIVKYKFIPYIY
ncbi:hypothetical protein BB561_003631 [Smittium simulii]|uniref:Delta(14)-sterol reductase n=1 Tax=Smittium simulii TaxID=133385 RepID=A0A2T9YK85_9FUNG|nr:hypothetical protein BB561_003631 [Smittium simulii]